jgi:hypothetical protein
MTGMAVSWLSTGDEWMRPVKRSLEQSGTSLGVG